MSKTGVGLFGTNGHQVQQRLANHPKAKLVAVAAFGDVETPVACRRYDGLAELLADPKVQLVSLCSPLRADQAAHAIACMRAGKHVYAEKPCAMTEADLDAVMAASLKTGTRFHEMAGTVVEQPYMTMRKVVQSGVIGEVVQVLAQKSYPWHDARPGDERVDGGLAMQVGVYAARFVEHIAGVEIASIRLAETCLGNPHPGSACRRAAAFLMTLANGGVANGICNYLNPMCQRVWGYEALRIFGTQGMVESYPEGPRARLTLVGEEPRDLDISAPSLDYFDLFAEALTVGAPMPLTMDRELRPTRWVIRAKEEAARLSKKRPRRRKK